MAPKEDPAPPERRWQRAAVRRGQLRVSAFEIMLFGATMIVGAAAAPVPPRLFVAFVVWLVGYLSLFIPPLL